VSRPVRLICMQMTKEVSRPLGLQRYIIASGISSLLEGLTVQQDIEPLAFLIQGGPQRRQQPDYF
jgi:hypothetical protein